MKVYGLALVAILVVLCIIVGSQLLIKSPILDLSQMQNIENLDFFCVPSDSDFLSDFFENPTRTFLEEKAWGHHICSISEQDKNKIKIDDFNEKQNNILSKSIQEYAYFGWHRVTASEIEILTDEEGLKDFLSKNKVSGIVYQMSVIYFSGGKKPFIYWIQTDTEDYYICMYHNKGFFYNVLNIGSGVVYKTYTSKNSNRIIDIYF